MFGLFCLFCFDCLFVCFVFSLQFISRQADIETIYFSPFLLCILMITFSHCLLCFTSILMWYQGIQHNSIGHKKFKIQLHYADLKSDLPMIPSIIYVTCKNNDCVETTVVAQFLIDSRGKSQKITKLALLDYDVNQTNFLVKSVVTFLHAEKVFSILHSREDTKKQKHKKCVNPFKVTTSLLVTLLTSLSLSRWAWYTTLLWTCFEAVVLQSCKSLFTQYQK